MWIGARVESSITRYGSFRFLKFCLKKPKYLKFLVSVSCFLSVPVPIVTVLCVEASLQHFSSKTVGVSPFSNDGES